MDLDNQDYMWTWQNAEEYDADFMESAYTGFGIAAGFVAFNLVIGVLALAVGLGLGANDE